MLFRELYSYILTLSLPVTVTGNNGDLTSISNILKMVRVNTDFTERFLKNIP